MIPAEFTFLLAVLALAIVYGVWLQTKIPPRKSRERLRREWEAARKDHRASEHIRKLYVSSTTEQLRKECGL